ncbi:MAG: tetratricopeptide repeat protein [Desulfobacterales bacterium]|nr:tetratricopeptide repeat protein [Desulfobacterales bacterium]
MSLLNEAIRKKMARIGEMLVLAGTLILGTWYFSGSLSAQENIPNAANSAVQAIARNETAKPLPSHEEDIFYQKALRYHREDKLDQAIQMYKQVIRVNPEHQDALFNLSSAYLQLAAYSDAYPLLKRLEMGDHRNPDILVNLAIAEIGLGRPAEAIHLLDSAANQCEEPQFTIYFHRAAALSRLGKLEEARICYKKAEKLNTSHNYLIFNLAVLSDKLQRYDDAIHYYGIFLQQNNTLPPNEKKNIETRIRSLHAYLGANRNQTEVNSASQSKRSIE